MSKPPNRIDIKQGSLLDLITRAQTASRPSGMAEGALNVQHRLVGAITQAIKESPLSRWEIAGKMSELLGLEVSKHMLDAWTSEAKEYHRFPAEYLPAFCMATGSLSPLRVLSEAAGVFLLESPDALRSRIQFLDEQQKEISSEKRELQSVLKALESGLNTGTKS